MRVFVPPCMFTRLSVFVVFVEKNLCGCVSLHCVMHITCQCYQLHVTLCRLQPVCETWITTNRQYQVVAYSSRCLERRLCNDQQLIPLDSGGSVSVSCKDVTCSPRKTTVSLLFHLHIYLHMGQPTRPTQPSIPPGSVNE